MRDPWAGRWGRLLRRMEEARRVVKEEEVVDAIGVADTGSGEVVDTTLEDMAHVETGGGVAEGGADAMIAGEKKKVVVEEVATGDVGGDAELMAAAEEEGENEKNGEADSEVVKTAEDAGVVGRRREWAVVRQKGILGQAFVATCRAAGRQNSWPSATDGGCGYVYI
ncbi:hypothetical protein ACHAPU_010923 [Fusarium lateritium]